MVLNQEQLAQLKAFCVKNYNHKTLRYDVFVETYEDADWQRLAEGLNGIREVKSMMKTLASVWHDRSCYQSEDF